MGMDTNGRQYFHFRTVLNIYGLVACTYSCSLSTAAMAVSICVWAVAAPTCGVLTTRPVAHNPPYLSFVGGSCSWQSRPAPHMSSSFNAFSKSDSFTIPPRAVLIKIALRFMIDSWGYAIKFRVCGRSGICNVTMSDPCSSSSSVCARLCGISAHASCGSNGSYAITLQLRPRWKMLATRYPILPMPTIPIVF